MKKLYYILLLAVISMTMVSCDDRQVWWDTPPYESILIGCWESYCEVDGYDEYDIVGRDVVSYDFYGNHTGRYTFYSYMGLSYLNFEWETRGYRLLIWFEDGVYEEWYYDFDQYGYLMLSSSQRFHHYLVFSPFSYYYEPEKSFDPLQAKRFDTTTDAKPQHVALKQQ